MGSSEGDGVPADHTPSAGCAQRGPPGQNHAHDDTHPPDARKRDGLGRIRRMTTPIRWGLLATGGIARTFATDLQLLPDCEILAVGSRAQTTADAFAADFGAPRSYGIYAELAADPD